MLAGLPRPRGQPVELFDIGKPCLRISVVQFGHHEGTVAPLRPAGYRDSLVDVPLGGQARSGSSRQPAGRWRPAQAGVPRKWLVVSTDIANRGFGTPGFDFPTCRKMRNGCRSLVTPPVRRFRLRQRTDEIRWCHAMALTASVQGQLALLVRLQWLAGRRAADVLSAGPFAATVILTQRIQWFDRGPATKSAQHHHAWVVFDCARPAGLPPTLLYV